MENRNYVLKGSKISKAVKGLFIPITTAVLLTLASPTEVNAEWTYKLPYSIEITTGENGERANQTRKLIDSMPFAIKGEYRGSINEYFQIPEQPIKLEIVDVMKRDFIRASYSGTKVKEYVPIKIVETNLEESVKGLESKKDLEVITNDAIEILGQLIIEKKIKPISSRTEILQYLKEQEDFNKNIKYLLSFVEPSKYDELGKVLGEKYINREDFAKTIYLLFEGKVNKTESRKYITYLDINEVQHVESFNLALEKGCIETKTTLNQFPRECLKNSELIETIKILLEEIKS